MPSEAAQQLEPEEERTQYALRDEPSPPALAEDEAELAVPAGRPPPVRVSSRILIGLFTLAVFYTLYFAKAVLIPVALALLLNLLLAPIVRAMRKYLRLPEGVGAILVLLLMATGVVGAFYGLSGPAARWLAELPVAMQEVEYKLRLLREPVEQVQEAAQQVERAAQQAGGGQGDQPVPVAVRGPGLTQTVLSGTATFTAALVVTVALLYFLLASGDSLLRQAVRISPRWRDKKRVVEIVRSMEDDVSYYLLTVSLINAGLGVAVGTVMFLLGMPNPILWGVMAAIFNFVPYLGALTGIGIIAVVALVSFDDVFWALLPPLSYLMLTSLEGQFVTPALVARRLTLNPVAVFIALIVLTWMWGAPGALLAVPMLATFKICCDHIEALEPVGAMLGE